MMKKTLTWGLSAGVLLCLAVAVSTPALAIGTRAGTTISNSATVNFQDVNGNPLSATSLPAVTTVLQVAGALVDPDNAQTMTPGVTYYYSHTVTNTGNFDATVNLTVASSQSWAVQIYRDNGIVGTYEPGIDVLLTDSASDADAIPDSGLLINDTSMKILVAVSVPPGTPNATVDVTTVTGVSSFNASGTDIARDTTTISAPTVVVTKSVDQPTALPGATLTYTITVTNTGSGPANANVLTDQIPANTTYAPGSITLDGVAQGDGNADGDSGEYIAGPPRRVSVALGNLAAGAPARTVTFKVTIN